MLPQLVNCVFKFVNRKSVWRLLSSYHFEGRGAVRNSKIGVGEMKCGANTFPCESAAGFRAYLDQVYTRDFCMR